MPTSNESSRRSQRIYVNMPIRVVVDFEGTDVAHEMTSVDFSTLGIRVRSSIAMVPGEHVGCVVPGWQAAVPGRVIWSAPARAQQQRETGIEFLKPFQTRA